MSINIYETHTMLEAVKVMPPIRTFLKDRYFTERKTFPSHDVIIDYEDEVGNRLAPFVLPSKGGIPVAREGFETQSYTPALVAPERVLTVEDLMHRQAGEALFSGKNAASREASYLRGDIEALNRMIANREELMCAKVLLENAYTMKQYGDKYGSSEYVEKTIKFYEGPSNPAVYTPSANWSTASTAILSDIAAIAKINTKRGLPMTDLIVGSAVTDVLLANEHILKLLDNRRYVLADKMEPEELPSGAVLIADLNVAGHRVRIYSYTAEYIDPDDGQSKPFIPAKKIVMTAPGMGRIAYGAVTQIITGTTQFETYEGDRIPKISVNDHDSVRSLIMQSRPLVMPKVKNAAISATVLS